jgi:hypothetical protein
MEIRLHNVTFHVAHLNKILTLLVFFVCTFTHSECSKVNSCVHHITFEIVIKLVQLVGFKTLLY